jgi:hypothetical protein
MATHKKIFISLVLAGLASAQVYAAGTTTPPTPTTPTSTTTPPPPPSTTTGTSTGPTVINMTDNCAGGGTRKVTGSYGGTAGALDITTTLAACVARNGDKFDGTTSTKGALLPTATGFTIDITASVNTTVTRADRSTVVRVCTTTKKGTFTNATQTFDGKTAETDCSVTGKVLEHEGIVEHLLRPATGGEDGGAQESTQRTLPPQAGEDSIRELPHATQPAVATSPNGNISPTAPAGAGEDSGRDTPHATQPTAPTSPTGNTSPTAPTAKGEDGNRETPPATQPIASTTPTGTSLTTNPQRH